MQRHDLKEKYNLDGDCATDCLKAWCCGCCDLYVTTLFTLGLQSTNWQQDPTRQGSGLPHSQLHPYGRGKSASREGEYDCW